MQTIPNPDSWMDVVTILLVAALASIPSWFAIKARQSSDEVRNQVVNGHADAPPLRADLDRVIASLDQLSQDVRAIRTDLRDEEERRREHVGELREEVHRRITELHARFDQI